MKVPKTFAKAAKASAEQMPRQVISGLLTRLMPRAETNPVPLSQAASQPSRKGETPSRPATSAPSAATERRPRTAKRSTAANRRYRVVAKYGYANHRRRTWRRAMTECILCTDNELDALRELVERYPEYAEKGVDLTWVAEHAGYVEII